MQRLFQSICLIAICVIEYGCPFETSIPISDPRSNYIDQQLLGRWKNRKDGLVFTISKYDDYTFEITHSDQYDLFLKKYSFMSFVNGQSFLCVPQYDGVMEEHVYYLLSISIGNSGNTLTVRGLKQPSGFYPKNSGELINWIADNMNSNGFYSTDPEDNFVLDRDPGAASASIPNGFVSSLNNVIADYPNRFSNITGSVIPLKGDVYESMVNLAGANESWVVKSKSDGLYFTAHYIPSYANTDEAYNLALKQFRDMIYYFENYSFSIPLVKSRIIHISNKQEAGDQEEQDFINSSEDNKFWDMVIRIKLSKVYDVKDQMDSKSWKQYYAVSITIKR